VSYIPKTISEVVLEYINRTTFLPAIQREYVWDTDGIEKLFDSIMGNYPIVNVHLPLTTDTSVTISMS
jgi:uncharacterized protein with ParB-like and HNH nuclease domain